MAVKIAVEIWSGSHFESLENGMLRGGHRYLWEIGKYLVDVGCSVTAFHLDGPSSFPHKESGIQIVYDVNTALEQADLLIAHRRDYLERDFGILTWGCIQAEPPFSIQHVSRIVHYDQNIEGMKHAFSQHRVEFLPLFGWNWETIPEWPRRENRILASVTDEEDIHVEALISLLERFSEETGALPCLYLLEGFFENLSRASQWPKWVQPFIPHGAFLSELSRSKWFAHGTDVAHGCRTVQEAEALGTCVVTPAQLGTVERWSSKEVRLQKMLFQLLESNRDPQKSELEMKRNVEKWRQRDLQSRNRLLTCMKEDLCLEFL